MEKKTIKHLLTRLIELQRLIQNETASIPITATNFAYRHVESLKREYKQLWVKCEHWGKHEELTLCMFSFMSYEDNIPKPNNFQVIYPSHDDEIIALLIKRDYKEQKPHRIIKLKTGHPISLYSPKPSNLKQ